MIPIDPYAKHQEVITAYLNMLADDLNYGLIVLSRGGLGKTTLIMDTMQEKRLERGKHFIYANNYSTPLKFYELLDRANNLKPPRFLVLDDIELIMDSKHILSMLRSALWEAGGKRTVNYLSTSGKVKSDEIDFTGRIIILLNDMPAENRVLGALKDRVFFHEINLTNEEVVQIMRQKIVPQAYKNLSLKQRIRVWEELKGRVTEKHAISFRTLIKAYQAFIFAPTAWTGMLDAMLGVKQVDDTSPQPKGLTRMKQTTTIRV